MAQYPKRGVELYVWSFLYSDFAVHRHPHAIRTCSRKRWVNSGFTDEHGHQHKNHVKMSSVQANNNQGKKAVHVKVKSLKLAFHRLSLFAGFSWRSTHAGSWSTIHKQNRAPPYSLPSENCVNYVSCIPVHFASDPIFMVRLLCCRWERWFTWFQNVVVYWSHMTWSCDLGSFN